MTTKTLKHAFTSVVADNSDTNLVRPTNWNAEHQFNLGVNAQTGTTYTIADSDHLCLITLSNAATIAVTLPQAGTGGAFASGWMCYVRNVGVGTATITPTTSTINAAATLVLESRSGAIIISDATNYIALPTPASPTGFFSVYQNGDQSPIDDDAYNKIRLDTEIADVNGWFDSSTNYRYVPQVAGSYVFFGSVRAQTTATASIQGALYLNSGVSGLGVAGGAAYWTGVYSANLGLGAFITTYVQGPIPMNGTTDYVELFVYVPPTITATGANSLSLFGWRGGP